MRWGRERATSPSWRPSLCGTEAGQRTAGPKPVVVTQANIPPLGSSFLQAQKEGGQARFIRPGWREVKQSRIKGANMKRPLRGPQLAPLTLQSINYMSAATRLMFQVHLPVCVCVCVCNLPHPDKSCLVQLSCPMTTLVVYLEACFSDDYNRSLGELRIVTRRK